MITTTDSAPILIQSHIIRTRWAHLSRTVATPAPMCQAGDIVVIHLRGAPGLVFHPGIAHVELSASNSVGKLAFIGNVVPVGWTSIGQTAWENIRFEKFLRLETYLKVKNVS